LERDGTLELGFPAKRKTIGQSNLCFDNSDPVTQVEFQQQKIDFVVDMGREITQLYAPFARDFVGLIRQSGQKTSTRVTGLSGGADVDSITLPQVTLRIGGLDTVLRPAEVLLDQTLTQNQRFHGSLGMDVLIQPSQVTVDFKALTMVLEQVTNASPAGSK